MYYNEESLSMSSSCGNYVNTHSSRSEECSSPLQNSESGSESYSLDKTGRDKRCIYTCYKGGERTRIIDIVPEGENNMSMLLAFKIKSGVAISVESRVTNQFGYENDFGRKLKIVRTQSAPVVCAVLGAMYSGELPVMDMVESFLSKCNTMNEEIIEELKEYLSDKAQDSQILVAYYNNKCDRIDLACIEKCVPNEKRIVNYYTNDYDVIRAGDARAINQLIHCGFLEEVEKNNIDVCAYNTHRIVKASILLQDCLAKYNSCGGKVNTVLLKKVDEEIIAEAVEVDMSTTPT